MSKAEDGAAAATTLTCKQQRQAGSTDLVLFKSRTLLEKDARSWGESLSLCQSFPEMPSRDMPRGFFLS